MRFAVLATILALTGCATAPAPRGPRETVEALFAAFNRHDLAAMEALYARDAEHHSPAFCAPKRGPTEIAGVYRALFEAMPDVRDDIERMVVEGDNVALTFVGHADLGGRDLDLHIAAFIEVRAGRIVREETFYDVAGACT